MTDDSTAEGGDEFEWNRPATDDGSNDTSGDDSQTTDGSSEGDRTAVTDGREPTTESEATETASVPSSAELSRPPSTWAGDGDPTGSSTWKWLTWATVFSGLMLTFWSVPLVLLDVADRSGFDDFGFGVGLLVLALFALSLLVRVFLLPFLLYRDATKLNACEEVDWAPSRTFYLGTGALFATLACAYYLFKRQRHVGNPTIVRDPHWVYYEDRRVSSNWHQVLLFTLAFSFAVGGIGSGLTVLDAVSPDLSTALLGPFLLVIVVALLLRFVLLPVAFYKDAAAVNAADVDWAPNGTLYAVLGYVFALPAVGLYLYRRHDRTGDLFDR